MDEQKFKMLVAQQVVIYKKLIALENKEKGSFRSAPDSTYLQELIKEAMKIIDRI